MLLQSLRDNDRIVGLSNVIRAVNGVDLYLVFEIVETDLAVVLKKKIVQDIHRKYLSYQIIKVVAQLHAKHIIHRDLKPSNILINDDCTIKLADFGLARTFIPKEDNPLEPTTELTDHIATRWYRSPEILVRSTHYTTSMDMWAVGCIVAELFTGQPLFAGNSSAHQFGIVMKATVGKATAQDLQSLRSSMGLNKVWDLIASLPSDTPTETVTDIMYDCDPDAVDLVNHLIVFNPKKRLTALEALKHPYVSEFVTEEDFATIERQVPIALPLLDEKEYDAKEYEKALYTEIRKVFRFL
ncbi:map-kinase like proteinue [Angomonas deanei]|nr:map-kinase like proteinue [Angomonas deanei]|eukprot:EPY32560.1 map-kinase like proteinue [Angomonas deanei]